MSTTPRRFKSLGNPQGNVSDIARLVAQAHKHGVPLIVDNTVPTPYLSRPIEHGADIVGHSLTKYLVGHGTAVGGAIVDSGKFPWAQHKQRLKRLNEPDVSHHGVVHTDALGPAAYIGRARVVPLRNIGAAISPFNAWLILQGIETVALRVGPASTTHRPLSPAELDKAGVSEGAVRLSLGIEHIDDLLADPEQSLAAV